MSVPKSKNPDKCKKIEIANPVSGGSTHTSHEHARRLVGKGRAHYDARGRLVFHGRKIATTSAGLDVLDGFGGFDAKPRRAVMPPWPNRDMQAFQPGRPVRPPVQVQERVMAAGMGAGGL